MVNWCILKRESCFQAHSGGPPNDDVGGPQTLGARWWAFCQPDLTGGYKRFPLPSPPTESLGKVSSLVDPGLAGLDGGLISTTLPKPLDHGQGAQAPPWPMEATSVL